MDIGELRKEYTLKNLHRKDLHENPFQQFDVWFREALKAQVTELNAMALSTISLEGTVSSRMVLLKYYDESSFVFFTYLTSRKATQLKTRPQAALLFFWKEIERQIQIEGTIRQISHEVAAAYFQKRPRNSQLAAWASHQDAKIPCRKTLEENFQHYEKWFKGQEVPMPEWWGGYELQPIRFEFWQGRHNRLHDRFLYLKNEKDWRIERLSP
ncbi:Pyridoxine/pyridoxamine 5'-phosphate oxidase [Chlamydiales bacterium STE3]|nr:Pyridoxine/pyridoxamine 5'-phosphate oxidase [Chlamydiales bacterium STE3]